MPGLSSWLSDVSRRKLRVALRRDSLRDTPNLHRFVLLKNSITQAQVESPPLPQNPQPSPVEDDSDIFLYPEAPLTLEPVGDSPSHPDSEEKWLESVLETLDDDFDGEVEVDIHPVEEDDDLEFSDLASDTLYDSWSPPHGVASPTSIAHTFLSSPSVLPAQSFPQATQLQPPFDSHFNQPFIEPRYPEADYDLPTSDASSDSDSDDDGPLTPFSGSHPSLGERGVAEPEVYVEHDSYFLYPSELDPISPLYYQQC